MFDKPSTLDGAELFRLIRAESKFCSRCGGKLDIKYKDWHLPFCTNCRIEVVAKDKTLIRDG